MAQMRIFVSHSSADKATCDALVSALRGAGSDVWYDEHDLGAGVLRDEIMRELAARPVVVVILSKAAFNSRWVRDECEWAYNLYRRKPERLILPVVAGAYDPDDFDKVLYLESMKRVEGPGNRPYPLDEMIARTLQLLALTPAGQQPAAVAPQPTESVDDLLTQGKALSSQEKDAEALPFFQLATQLNPNSFDAWFNLAYTLGVLGRSLESLAASEKALALDPNDASSWGNMGNALFQLGRHAEAVMAYDKALALDPNLPQAWTNKGNMLCQFGRYAEALAAYDKALALDPNDFVTWTNKGNALTHLQRYEEALAACDKALALKPNSANVWNGKGSVLDALKRYGEALAAYDKALALDPNLADAWYNKGCTLEGLKRFQEALAAYERGFDPNNAVDWNAKARVLRALGRNTGAAEAERRAKALGG
jgi:tetratricopeptide (TPR) repeat protein